MRFVRTLSGEVKANGALLGSWAERVGLTNYLLQRFPHEVSEGQLQRTCLARSLILEPGYLICDELGSMLDVSTQAALLEVVSEEKESRGLGVILITHDRILTNHWRHEIMELAANDYNAAGG